MLVEHGDTNPTHISPILAYFLALHGIELTLTAYLHHKGVTVKKLRGKIRAQPLCLSQEGERPRSADYL
jgi:hypothetical protein